MIDWTTVLGSAGAVVAVGGAFWGGLRRAHTTFVRGVAESVATQLAPVRAELHHNGGSSLKDQVVTIRQQLTDHKAATAVAFERVEKHLDRQDERIDNLYREER